MAHHTCMRFLYINIICDCVCFCVCAPLALSFLPGRLGLPSPFPTRARPDAHGHPNPWPCHGLPPTGGLRQDAPAGAQFCPGPRPPPSVRPSSPANWPPVPPGTPCPRGLPRPAPGARAPKPRPTWPRRRETPWPGSASLGAPAPPSSHRPSGPRRPRPPPANVHGSGPRPRGPAHLAPPRQPSELANWQVRRRQRPRCRKPRGLPGGRARLPTGLGPRQGSQRHGVSQRPTTAMTASQLASTSGHAARRRQGRPRWPPSPLQAPGAAEGDDGEVCLHKSSQGSG